LIFFLSREFGSVVVVVVLMCVCEGERESLERLEPRFKFLFSSSFSLFSLFVQEGGKGEGKDEGIIIQM
jgi:hypothetical protein